MKGSSDTKFLQDILLYAASAALSCLVLVTGLQYLDPNRESSKKALEHKKEIAKRLGRPLINTNSYEVPSLQLFLTKFSFLVVFTFNIFVSTLFILFYHVTCITNVMRDL
jgi:hypothetical protein